MDEFLKFMSAHLDKESLWQLISIDAVILLGFIWLLLFLTTRLLNLFKELVGMIDGYKEEHKKEAIKNAPKDYSVQVFNNPDIRYILRVIRHDLQADRVSIYQYHNGEESIARNPFMKVSCTHEVLGPKAISVIAYMKDVQLDMFDGTTTKIFKNEIYKQKFVSDLQKDGDSRTLAQTLSKIGTTSIYMIPLKTPLGEIFGFGSVEYCCTPTDLEDKWVDWLREKFSQVGTLLSADVLVKANKISQDQIEREKLREDSNGQLG